MAVRITGEKRKMLAFLKVPEALDAKNYVVEIRMHTFTINGIIQAFAYCMQIEGGFVKSATRFAASEPNLADLEQSLSDSLVELEVSGRFSPPLP